ncbi:septation ring formation regulator EzrA [Bacillus sp. FJAT-45350]|uniref:septation ring formation regulator EzrA n=1 Tax=Bacillus sp. FJAT-45350 TaxID=2011014 RepID=UPI000BB775F7|nr:septation ring formation regulator EzrA [Bacillus sp. FJAT-45350]
MYLLFAAIALVIILFIFGSIQRKRIYTEVDRLEEWKMDILNRPITDEIGRVKGLKMSGETEEKFEDWRVEWDEIVGVKLPDIEEGLFDIEEYANKYRFKKAKLLTTEVNQELEEIEERLKTMLDDVSHLIESEEQNRTEIGDVRKLYSETKKYFNTHRASLGKTATAFDERLDTIYSGFSTFEEATKQGNYIKARELLLSMKEELETEHSLMTEIPKMLVQLQTNITADLKDIQIGMKDMEEAGYVILDFNLEKEITRIKNECAQLVKDIEEIQLDGIKEKTTEIENEIEGLYDLLEEEVKSKQVVEESIEPLHEKLENTRERLLDLQEETETVQQSYRISEEELRLHEQIEKQLSDLKLKLGVIVDVSENNKQSFTSIRILIDDFKKEFEKVHLEIESCQTTLDTLRQDELKAKETLKGLKGMILEGKRMIQKSNIPGLPQSVLDEIVQGEQKLVEAAEKIEEIPLEMVVVNEKVEEAKEHVNTSNQLIFDTIEKADLAERLIQYGNRYRSRSERVMEQLGEAEQCFRNFYYEDAIEIAISTIEKYEPNVIEKLNAVPVEEKV